MRNASRDNDYDPDIRRMYRNGAECLEVLLLEVRSLRAVLRVAKIDMQDKDEKLKVLDEELKVLWFVIQKTDLGGISTLRRGGKDE